MVNLWLDDVRPAPEGWVWCKNIIDAKALMKSEIVDKMSLDHDMGTCQACEDYYQLNSALWQKCEHTGTGYDFVMWMVEYNSWPRSVPTVHSANPSGREAMEKAIERFYPRG